MEVILDKKYTKNKALKKAKYSKSPLSKEQFEYLSQGKGVDNRNVKGETGFFWFKNKY